MSTLTTPQTLHLGAARRSLREQVADHVRTEIVDGTLPPGTRLVEQELADRLGVSRVPVREAIRGLESEGFVARLPRRGVVVSSMTRKDFDDLFDVREALEVQAVRLATQRAQPDEVRELAELVTRGAKALTKGDMTTFAAMNDAFHDQIIDLAHNAILSSMLHPLQGRLHWLLRQNTNPALVCEEHQALYQAIASGKPGHAARVATQHVRTSRKLAAEVLYRAEAVDA